LAEGLPEVRANIPYFGNPFTVLMRKADLPADIAPTSPARTATTFWPRNA
jgi:hypothetical protein